MVESLEQKSSVCVAAPWRGGFAGGSGQSSRWIWRRRQQMALVVLTSSNGKGSSDAMRITRQGMLDMLGYRRSWAIGTWPTEFGEAVFIIFHLSFPDFSIGWKGFVPG